MAKRRTTDDKPTKAVAYLRVSTDKQAEKGTSLSAQREQVGAYAKLYGLEIVEWIEDGGESAKSLRRPGLKRALKALDSGDAKALIVAKLDRLTRSVRDLAELMDRYFGSGRYGLLSVGEQVDTRSATGRMVLNVITTISQWERERIGERVADMHKVKASRGERVGKPPFGYKVGSDGRSLVEHRGEQKTLRQILALRERGLSYQRIAEELTETGRAARGSRWHPTTVARIIKRHTSP